MIVEIRKLRLRVTAGLFPGLEDKALGGAISKDRVLRLR